MDEVKKKPKAKVIIIGVALFAGFFFLVGSCDSRGGRAIRAVKEVLKAPASADFQGTTVFWEEGDRSLVHVMVDASNSFNAKIRATYCVCLRKENGMQVPKFVRECQVDPDNKNDIYRQIQISSCMGY